MTLSALRRNEANAASEKKHVSFSKKPEYESSGDRGSRSGDEVADEECEELAGDGTGVVRSCRGHISYGQVPLGGGGLQKDN